MVQTKKQARREWLGSFAVLLEAFPLLYAEKLFFMVSTMAILKNTLLIYNHLANNVKSYR